MLNKAVHSIDTQPFLQAEVEEYLERPVGQRYAYSPRYRASSLDRSVVPSPTPVFRGRAQSPAPMIMSRALPPAPSTIRYRPRSLERYCYIFAPSRPLFLFYINMLACHLHCAVRWGCLGQATADDLLFRKWGVRSIAFSLLPKYAL